MRSIYTKFGTKLLSNSNKIHSQMINTEIVLSQNILSYRFQQETAIFSEYY